VLPAPCCFSGVPVTVCLAPFFLKVCFRAGLGLLAAGVVSVLYSSEGSRASASYCALCCVGWSVFLILF
jgi:hypothetical protein